ncbi:hypothetical protein Glove_431g30 [Diversispora epigaea]|uniref:Transmembrane protein 14C n=1 Tax=Diversispora epigaea TaxID=1348612 RepID=A0A397GT88_9GLOM|nr:hypothetical protein Glove_431g30 [Diversispora epigaea]
MAYRPSYTMGAICAVGGIAGYVTKRSVPSIIAGLGIGALYVLGGVLMQRNKIYGYETSLAASIILAGSMVPRTIKRGTPIPLSLSILSIGMGTYYVKKIYDQRFSN